MRLDFLNICLLSYDFHYSLTFYVFFFQAKLTCRIKHALIALYQAEQHLPSDEPADSKLSLEFRTQIERLRSKLQQIAGPAALIEFDRNRASGIALVPSPCSASGAYSALPGRLTNEQLAHELLLDPAFQLDESGSCSAENPIYHRIRESFHQVMMVVIWYELFRLH